MSLPEAPMIIESTLIEVKPGQEEAYEKVQGQIHALVSQAEGFRAHSVARSIEKPNTYLVTVEWQTLEDHTVGFVGSDAFKSLIELVGPFAAAPPQVQHFRPLES